LSLGGFHTIQQLFTSLPLVLASVLDLISVSPVVEVHTNANVIKLRSQYITPRLTTDRTKRFTVCVILQAEACDGNGVMKTVSLPVKPETFYKREREREREEKKQSRIEKHTM